MSMKLVVVIKNGNVANVISEDQTIDVEIVDVTPYRTHDADEALALEIQASKMDKVKTKLERGEMYSVYSAG